MEITKDNAVELNAELDKLEKPILESGKVLMPANKESYDKGLRDEQARIDTTLNAVHDVFRKYLFIEDMDRLDLALAIGINYKERGTPLWVFLVSPPGDWKSELLMSFTGLHDVIMLDQITKNTLASGLKDTVDLGSQLQDKRSLLIFPDLASLLSCNKDDKRIIWGQFRELYDGRINKRTGSGVVRKYNSCQVNILASATPVLRNEYLLHQQIGTRELLYDCDPEQSQDKNKMDHAWDNEEYEEKMRKELRTVTSNFCLYHKLQKVKIPNEIKEFLQHEASRLALLRATGDIDWNTGELKGFVIPEIPTRLIKQFKRLWIALMSLDPEYSETTAKRIIIKLVNSSGSKTRQKILDVFKLPNNKNDWVTVPDLQLGTKLGRRVVKAECEQLWNLGSLEKQTVIMHFGGDIVPDRDGQNAWSRGFDREVDQYRAVTQKKL